HELQRLSPLVRVETLCESTEGRADPLLVIGQPVPASPYGLRTDKRMVVYIQANIHAGEVEGKEASLMVARDVALGPAAACLDKLVLLIAPIFNADGNERISPENRTQQPGPEQGVGVRPNGQNLDLNRDSMKLESPELRGLVRNVLGRWDPALVVDCHTTDGAFHDETVTWSWPVNPNGDLPLLEFQRDMMLPAINAIMKDKYGTLGLPYGIFRDWKAPEKGWETFDPQPRYVTNYVGLRNRLSILDENYVHADYRTRVLGNYAFLRAIIDYAAEHAEELVRRVAEADLRTVRRGLAPKKTDLVAVEYELRALPRPVTIHGYETEVVERPETWPEMKKTDRKRIYTVPHFAEYVPKRSVRFPFAYLLPAPDAEVVGLLLRHGLLVEKLAEAVPLEVETFLPREVKGAERPYQGHRLNTVKGEYAVGTMEFAAGTVVVRTGQPLGCLAAGLLEPESDDGLVAWNFFERRFAAQWERGYLPLPVHKLLAPVNLVTTAIED
ncbi:MAG TPA: M14 family metallopeptidase, partial [Acidobacteriota bacterium]|nr:M14 family metallopeptidase [Acidobacteriota bacterium]